MLAVGISSRSGPNDRDGYRADSSNKPLIHVKFQTGVNVTCSFTANCGSSKLSSIPQGFEFFFSVARGSRGTELPIYLYAYILPNQLYLR
jgi:hypothetical protein